MLFGVGLSGVLGVVRAGGDRRDIARPRDLVIDKVSGNGGVAVVHMVFASGIAGDELDGVRIDASMQELRRDQRETAEVTLEHVHGSLDGIRVGVAVIRDLAGVGRSALGVDEVGELTLERRSNDGFMGAELSGLFVDRSHHVLNVVLGELIDGEAGTNDGRCGGGEVLVDAANFLPVVAEAAVRGLNAILRLGIDGSGGEFGLDPSGEASGAVGKGSVVERRKDIRREGELHGALQVDGGLRELTRELVLNAGDVQDILRQVGHVDRPTEHVDVVFNFRSVVLGVLLELRVGGRRGRIDVSTVKDAELDRGFRVTIDLPAEGRVAGLRATLSHRGDGRVLSVDVEDQVREFFSDTDASAGEGALILEFPFIERCHGLFGLDELVFKHVGQIIHRSRLAIALHTHSSIHLAVAL